MVCAVTHTNKAVTSMYRAARGGERTCNSHC